MQILALPLQTNRWLLLAYFNHFEWKNPHNFWKKIANSGHSVTHTHTLTVENVQFYMHGIQSIPKNIIWFLMKEMNYELFCRRFYKKNGLCFWNILQIKLSNNNNPLWKTSIYLFVPRALVSIIIYSHANTAARKHPNYVNFGHRVFSLSITTYV